MKLKRPFRVLILMEMSEKSQRDWLQGILRYAKWNGPWEIHLQTGYPTESAAPPILPGAASFDGLIGSAVSEYYCDIIANSTIPTLVIEPYELRPDFPVDRFHVLKSNTRAAGWAGAEFLLARNWNYYAYVHDENLMEWSLIRGEGFVEKIREAGYESFVYAVKTDPSEPSRLHKKNQLAQWLSDLPKPIGLMAANDFCGRQVIEICRNVGICVPDDVAVLGVDNDPLLCESTLPSLSSLSMTSSDAGYKGGELLDQLMRGRSLDKPLFILSGPGEIVQRDSTHLSLNSDPVITKSLEYIHLNIDTNFTIEDIADYVGISRRSLELRFRKTRDSSIAREISKYRLKKVKFLLRHTDYTLSKIARLSGFSNENYLAHVFRKEFHLTMTQFRVQ